MATRVRLMSGWMCREDGAKGDPSGVICGLHQPLHLDQAYTLIHGQDSYVSKGGPFMIGTLRIKGIRFQISFCFPMGSLRMRFPVAAKMALVIAGGVGGNPASPPEGSYSLSIILTLMIGESFIFAILYSS